MNIKILIQIIIGLTGYSVWAFMAFYDPAIRPDFLHFNIVMAMGTIGLVVRDMKSTPATPPSEISTTKETT